MNWSAGGLDARRGAQRQHEHVGGHMRAPPPRSHRKATARQQQGWLPCVSSGWLSSCWRAEQRGRLQGKAVACGHSQPSCSKMPMLCAGQPAPSVVSGLSPPTNTLRALGFSSWGTDFLASICRGHGQAQGTAGSAKRLRHWGQRRCGHRMQPGYRAVRYAGTHFGPRPSSLSTPSAALLGSAQAPWRGCGRHAPGGRR